MAYVPILMLIGLLVAGAFAIAVLIAVIGPLSRAIGWLFRHIFRFIGGMLRDALRLAGALITSLFFVPLIAANVLIGRWSAASHYGRAIQAEFRAMCGCVYRMLVGHWARLLGLSDLTDGIERRLPEAMMAAPSADKPSGGKAGQFEGYQIIGSLPGGGSGGKLFIATPTPEKRAALARAGQHDVDRVVIKSFSLRDGSTLPQIVRENRAIPAARRMGLILEHELNEERFFYVTRYVPGESLSIVTQRLHAQSGPAGLDNPHLRTALSHTADLLRTLQLYHQGGLWHKDVKPDNIIVADGRAHLVDFGLITPLRSSMTLTTHGTEYFRDPEMVRMALRGVKVHEVDGSRFDLYAAGAVLYSVMEDSFPAHAGLSQLSKRCPDAVKWIIRRAMADYDKRYAGAAPMLADVEHVLSAPDPFAVKPIDLPSMKGASADDASEHGAPFVPIAAPVNTNHTHPWEADAPIAGARSSPEFNAAGASFNAAPQATFVPAAAAVGSAAQSGSPRLRVTDWWTGRYNLDHDPAFAGAQPHVTGTTVHRRAAPEPRVTPRGPGSSAAEQLVRARARAREARERAQGRINSSRRNKFEPSGINAGVIVGVLVFLALIAVLLVPSLLLSRRSVSAAQARPNPAPADGAWAIGSPDLDLSSWNRSLKASDTDVAPTGIILRDRVGFDTAAIAKVDSAIESLAKAGFEFTGEAYPSVLPAGGDHQRHLNVAASLRAAIGVAPFGSQDARQSIQTWLEANTPDAVVIWITGDSGGDPEVWAVAQGPGQHAGLSTLVSAFTPAPETHSRRR